MYFTTGLVVALVAAQAHATNPSPRSLVGLRARQVAGAAQNSTCTSECQPAMYQLDACWDKPTIDEQNACLCSDDYLDAIEACGSCRVKQSPLAEADVQKSLNRIASNCTHTGFIVKEPILNGGSSNAASSAAGISSLTVAMIVVGMLVFG